MSDAKRFLDSVYGLDDADATQALYRDWAATYEDEVQANGYASPARGAAALAAAADDLAAPLLDLGCGTGLSGAAFRKAGFTTIDGTDFSAEMLAVAEAKGIYRQLIPGDLNTPIPAAPGAYANIAAIGVFSPGHAPPEMIDGVIELLPPGGCFVFSLNDHALEDGRYEARVEALNRDGRIEIAHSEYGAHLPGKDLGATILVLRRR